MHVDIFMLACALFNEQNKESIPLSIIIMICIRKTSEKGLLALITSKKRCLKKLLKMN